MKRFLAPRFPRLRFAFAVALTMAAIAARAADPLATLSPTAILRTMPSETPANQQLAGLTFLGGYEAIGSPVPVPAAAAAKLAAALRAPDAFAGNGSEQKMRPGVAYRLGDGPQAAYLLVCFSCDKVGLIPAGSPAITTTHHLTQATRDALLGLAKKLLPGDEAIQALPRIRSEHPAPPPAAPIPKDAPRPGGV